MTQEQMQITMAYNRLLTHLKEQYDMYMKECVDDPEGYDGIREGDAYIWLVESL